MVRALLAKALYGIIIPRKYVLQSSRYPLLQTYPSAAQTFDAGTA